jgi:hypothetical protein
MRTILLSVAALAMLSTNDLHASACTPGSISTYIALGATGCSVGSFQFSHFDFLVALTNVNAKNVTTSDITVTPNIGPGGPDVDFAADWGTNSNILPSSYTATLSFRIESLTPFDVALTANTLDLSGSVGGLLSLATVAEVNCLGGLLNGGSLCLGGGITAGLSASLTPGDVSASAALLYNPPVTMVDVIKNLTLTSTGTLIAPAHANLSHIGQDFSSTTVPEPSGGLMFLLGTGAIFVLLAKARRNVAVGEEKKQ